MLDLVERPAAAGHLRARTQEEIVDLELERIAQHAGVVEIQPERGLERHAQAAGVEAGERGEAGGEVPMLARGDERAEVAGAARVHVPRTDRLERFRELSLV